MKKLMSVTLCLLTCLVLLVGCGAQDTPEPWDNATYTADTTLGSGKTVCTVAVKVDTHTVTFTLHTDKETVGAALQEHNLIAGDEGEFGLYIKQVNGITADYDANKAYWAFYENGQYAMTGVDTTAITQGVSYELVYTKE
ncbi:MAG: DUF4430 domain-containing protein [Ruminococcaceae bacterium]|nr:DUF4430 domain-containing protein [Oscillospiraceae bacterium]